MAKCIMIQGTSSNVGKSLISAGLCRIFANAGYKTAPFKSQNMALNSYITKQGLEIGRAQAVQAECAYQDIDVRFNPILLKPTGSKISQIIINGEVYGNMTAAEYFKVKHKFIKNIKESYESINSEYDIIVIEGAGSPAEINLNNNDFVNMGMAKIANAPVLLAGDIDRGGVFASFYGTVELLKEDKNFFKGFIINKFRGDKSILEPGLKQIEDLTGINVLGVLPFEKFNIDEEDSLSEKLQNNKKGIKVKEGGRHFYFDFRMNDTERHILYQNLERIVTSLAEQLTLDSKWLVQYTDDYGWQSFVITRDTIQMIIEQIQREQIHVQANGKLEIIPRVGKHTILLGEPKDFKKKLEKLKVFYEKGISQVGWNKYSEISLEYNDQIICTKNKD